MSGRSPHPHWSRTVTKDLLHRLGGLVALGIGLAIG